MIATHKQEKQDYEIAEGAETETRLKNLPGRKSREGT